MVLEDDFFRAIDADPEDQTTLLGFADWLMEHGDPREAGYREMVRLGKRPHYFAGSNCWAWWRDSDYARTHNPGCDRYWMVLPTGWMDAFAALPDVPEVWRESNQDSEFGELTGSDHKTRLTGASQLFDWAARAYCLWKKPKPKRRRGVKNVMLECGPENSPNYCFGLYARPFKIKGPKAGIERRESGPFSYTLVFVQTDWDYPGLAQSLGWYMMGAVQHPTGPQCPHRGTDGTVDCPDCGCTATDFISAAYDWLYERDGETFECHDYDNVETTNGQNQTS